MESHLSEEALWARGLASRLRLIQATTVEDASAVRQGYLTEEIERALSPIPPSRRTIHLDSLADCFPAWGVIEPAPGKEAKKAEPLKPEELAARLVELAPSLSPEARNAIAVQLQGVGLSVKEPPSAALELSVDLQKKLGLPAGQPVRIERALKWLTISTELVLALDQLAWALWRQVAPKSAIRKETDLTRVAGSYLGSDPEVSTTQLTQAVEKTRRLIAGLLGAVGRAGSTYAKQYQTRLSPEVIEDSARMQKKRLQLLEAACWQKFLEQSKAHASEQAIENEIQEAIAKAAENLILGRVAG